MGENIVYYVPSGPGEAEIEEKRSRFISYLSVSETEEQAKTFIADIKKKNYDARHNCWCYIIKNGPERYSDDGEPQGTAGIPMLEVLRHEKITNVVCVVTRYFGGVLLGTGGLARAYSKAAKEALMAAGISIVQKWIVCSINCPYPLYDRLRAEIAAAGGIINTTDYGSGAFMTLLIPEPHFSAFIKRVSDISSGAVTVSEEKNIFRSVPLSR